MNYWSNLKYMTRFAAVCLWNWYKERKGRVSFTLWRQLMGGVVQFHSAGWTCLNGLIQVNVITKYFLIYLFYQNIGFTIKRNIWNLNTILAGEEPGCTSSDRTMVQDAFFDWYWESEQKSGVYGLPGFGAADDRWV